MFSTCSHIVNSIPEISPVVTKEATKSVSMEGNKTPGNSTYQHLCTSRLGNGAISNELMYTYTCILCPCYTCTPYTEHTPEKSKKTAKITETQGKQR